MDLVLSSPVRCLRGHNPIIYIASSRGHHVTLFIVVLCDPIYTPGSPYNMGSGYTQDDPTSQLCQLLSYPTKAHCLDVEEVFVACVLSFVM
jgi:hypothetical protein